MNEGNVSEIEQGFLGPVAYSKGGSREFEGVRGGLRVLWRVR